MENVQTAWSTGTTSSEAAPWSQVATRSHSTVGSVASSTWRFLPLPLTGSHWSESMALISRKVWLLPEALEANPD